MSRSVVPVSPANDVFWRMICEPSVCEAVPTSDEAQEN